MRTVLAHGRFVLMQANYDLGRWGAVVAEPLDPQSPLVMTAAASLSGMLDSLPDDADDSELLECAEHGESLVAIGVRSRADWEAECTAVFQALERTFLGVKPYPFVEEPTK